MKTDLEKNFSEWAKAPEKFNRDYGAKSNKLDGIDIPKHPLLGLKFEKWKFHAVHFNHTSLHNCVFNETQFENCVFDFSEAKKCEFKNCKFQACTFLAAKTDSCRFMGGTLAMNVAQESEGFKPQFEGNVFSGVQMIGNKFPDLSFEGSTFDETLFQENDFTRGYLGRCAFTKPVFRKNTLIKTKFNTSKISGAVFQLNDHIGEFHGTEFDQAKFELRPNPENGAEAFDGAVLKNSSVDLKAFTGSFGVGGGEHSSYENLDQKKENFVLGEFAKPLKHNVYRNLKCQILNLDGGTYEDCLFENIDVDALGLESAHLKKCTFKNVRIREFVKFTNGTFEDVKWEKITTDPHCEIRTDQSSYQGKPPF